MTEPFDPQTALATDDMLAYGDYAEAIVPLVAELARTVDIDAVVRGFELQLGQSEEIDEQVRTVVTLARMLDEVAAFIATVR